MNYILLLCNLTFVSYTMIDINDSLWTIYPVEYDTKWMYAL